MESRLPANQSPASRFLIYWRILQHAATFWKVPMNGQKMILFDSAMFLIALLAFHCCHGHQMTSRFFFNGFNSCYMSRVYSLFPAVGTSGDAAVKRPRQVIDESAVWSRWCYHNTWLSCCCQFGCFFDNFLDIFSQSLLFFFLLLLYFTLPLWLYQRKNYCVVFVSDHSQISTLFPVIFFLNTFCVFPSAQMQFCLCRKKKTNLILGRTNPDGLLHLRRWTSHFRTSHSFSRHADANEV